MGAAAKRSVGLPPATGEAVPKLAQGTSAVNSQASAEEGRRNPSPVAAVKQLEGAQAEDEVATEARIIDIASILGAPTVVRSTL
jgi:hypothetical protein